MVKLNKPFKAAVLFKQKKPLKVIKLQLPRSLERGQVLVKVLSAAICGAQIGEIKGIKGPDKWLPHCMGHEGYGLVVSKHKSVKNVKKNDYVIMHWRKGKGIDAKPPSYLSEYGKINAGQVTTFQEYSIVSENRVTRVKKINEKYKFLMPLLGCAIPTSWGIIKNELNILTKQRSLIIGAGGVGSSIALILKVLGSKGDCITDKFNKKNFVKKLDINFINFNAVKKIKVGEFDNIIDTTGNTKVMELAFDLLGKNGKLMLVGQPKRNSLLNLRDPLKLFNPPCENIKILTSDGGLFEPSHQMKVIYDLLKNNLYKFKKIVTNRIKLEDINKGIKLINNGTALRVSIDI